VGRLEAADVHRLLEFSYDLGACSDARATPQFLLDRLVELIPCANAVQFDREGPVAFAGHVMCPPAVDEAAAAFALQRPTAVRRMTPRDGAITISGRLTPSELHRLDFYQEAMLPLGFEDELKILLPVEPASAAGFSLLRERPFTERERMMVDVLSPLLARASARAEPLPLTTREREILRWVGRGRTNKEIAGILGIRPSTVRKHLEHIFEKLDVHTRTAAVAKISGVEP
jgi:DNA-binding CsgD family transcriptional regulator